jgi:hypothetical protein
MLSYLWRSTEFFEKTKPKIPLIVMKALEFGKNIAYRSVFALVEYSPANSDLAKVSNWHNQLITIENS